MYVTRTALVFNLVDTKPLNALHGNTASTSPLPSALNAHAFAIQLAGANPHNTASPTGRYRHTENYYLGNDPTKWASGAAVFRAVTLQEVYPGINMELVLTERGLKYEFRLKPGASPDAIRLHYAGTNNVKLKQNELHIVTSVMPIAESAPVVWQTDGQPVACKYTLRGNVVGFNFPEGYDSSKGLILDPDLIFSTYSGSFSDNFGYTATYDNLGFLYSGSTAFGTGYPTTLGAYQVTFGGGSGLGAGTDIALTKYDTTGTELIYSTYLGGNSDEMPHSLITDNQGRLFVLGTTSSPNFPTVINSAAGSEFGGGASYSPAGLGVSYPNGSDVILSRLSADGGELEKSRYWGTEANDGLNTAANLRINYADEVRGDIALRDSVCFVVTSAEGETDQRGVVLKFSNDFETEYWSLDLTSEEGDASLYSIDVRGNEILVGGGTSGDTLKLGMYGADNDFLGGPADGVLGRITDGESPTVTALAFLGSPQYDQVYFCEFNQQLEPHLYGQTRAQNNALTANAEYFVEDGGIWVAKVLDDLNGYNWSTQIGLPNNLPVLSPAAFLVDLCNSVYISGWGGGPNAALGTTSGLPVTPDALQSTTDGNDFYLCVLADDGSELTYASFFGGGTSQEHVDGGTSRFDRAGVIYQSVCAGCGSNDDFPIFPEDAWSDTNNSTNCNNGVFKIDFGLPIAAASFSAPNVCLLDPVAFFNNSSGPGSLSYAWDFGDGTGSTAANPEHVYPTPGTYEVTLVLTATGSCNQQDSISQLVTIFPEIGLTIDADTLVSCTETSFTLTAEVTGPEESVTWFTAEETLATDVSSINFAPDTATWVFAQIEEGICLITDSILVVPGSGLSLALSSAQLCIGDTLQAQAQLIGGGASIAATNWQFDGTVLQQSNTDLTGLAVESGALIATVTSTAGCEYADTLQFTVFNPQLTLQQTDTLLCDAQLFPVSAQANGSVQWLANGLAAGSGSSVQIDVTSTTTVVAVVTEGECTTRDSLQIDLAGDISALLVNPCSTDTFNLVLSADEPDNLSDINWQPDSLLAGEQGEFSAQFVPGGDVEVVVTATANGVCLRSDTLQVEPSLLGEVSASVSDTTILRGDSIFLQALPDDPNLNYQWMPSQGVDSPQSAGTAALPPDSVTYMVIVSEQVGGSFCRDTAFIKVNVFDFICDEPFVFMPTAFSPNGDGQNDVLRLRGEAIAEMQLVIFNRWGEKVFETDNPVEGWDGTYLNEALEPDVFVYVLDVLCLDAQRLTKKGNITLLR